MTLRRSLLFLALAWTLLLAAALAITLRASYESALEHARVAARVAFEKDLNFRLWNSMRGGVYVLVNENNRPNPHLRIPERDLATADGRVLTMINPAYMTRQVYEIQKQTAEVQGHITSLDPIRPENAPDPWEAEALAAFERGETEVSMVTHLDGKRHMRIMRPVVVDAYCLRCHAEQGYREGEVRGGISASVPLEGSLNDLSAYAAKALGGYGLVWGIGLAGILVGGRRLEKGLEEERRARREAEAASRTKDEFLANMSHEIRTPLNGVLGMLQLLREDGDPGERKAFLGMAYESGQRLLALLNDILDFSRMEAGGFALARSPFRPRDLLDSTATVFLAACVERGLNLSVEADPSLPESLVGDEARLRQMLFNLVGNAIKFTPQGSVRVDAWARQIPGAPGRRRLYLSVRDTGIGIAEDKIGLVFERFTQEDASFTRQYQGAGLGLAIVKRLVDMMGGTISVDSAPGRGAEFVLQVPLDEPDDAPGTQEPSPCGPGAPCPEGPRRLLLVEDEDISRLAALALLKRAGYEVAGAADGREALEAVTSQRYHCVLMDIQMPVLNGVEATRAIREMETREDRPRTPIIALTAYAMPGDRERFLEAGMDDYVTKPLHMEELLACLERVMALRGGA